MNGNLKAMILRVLQEEPRSGYDIVKRIKEKTDWEPSYGSVYPQLEKLREEDILEVEQEGRKKIYSLTSEGREKAKESQDRKEEFYEEMKEKIQVMGEIMGEDHQVLLEMIENFKEEKNPLEPVNPELIRFRDKVFRMCLNGTAEEHADEIKQMLRDNLERLEGMQ